jgi:hypothetical protein
MEELIRMKEADIHADVRKEHEAASRVRDKRDEWPRVGEPPLPPEVEELCATVYEGRQAMAQLNKMGYELTFPLDRTEPYAERLHINHRDVIKVRAAEGDRLWKAADQKLNDRYERLREWRRKVILDMATGTMSQGARYDLDAI